MEILTEFPVILDPAIMAQTLDLLELQSARACHEAHGKRGGVVPNSRCRQAKDVGRPGP